MTHLFVSRGRRRRTSVLVLASRAFALISLLTITGCGTSFSELLFQTGTALGRTALDLLLTDVANQVADAREVTDTSDDGGADGTDGGDGAADADDGSDGDPGDAVGPDLGDTASGESVYADNGCAACHCADASGDCALSAPSLVGVDAATLDDFLRGDRTHPAKPSLSDRDIVDLEAYLGSL